MRLVGADRRQLLRITKGHFNAFLHRLDQYELLTKDDHLAWEMSTESREDLQEHQRIQASAGMQSQAAVREQKIERKKRELEAKARMQGVMDELALAPDDRSDLVDDDELYREHALLLIEAAARASLDHMEMVALEMEMIEYARANGLTPGQGQMPPAPPEPKGPPPANIVINNREEARAALFKTQPGWTMSVEEFGEQEMQQMEQNDAIKQAKMQAQLQQYAQGQGGMVSMEEAATALDEESDEETDASMMKKREWDDWMDDNPRQRNRGISGR